MIPLLLAALMMLQVDGPSASPATPLDRAGPLRVMAEHDVPGLAVALIRAGEPPQVETFGLRDREAGLPLTPDTVLYGASWTKFLFATYVLQLVDEGQLDLDTPIDQLLKQDLPAYDRFSDLRGDNRWRQLTLRLLLSHQTGFPNYRFWPPRSDYDPNAPLRFYRDPGQAYGYSGEGFHVAQRVVEDVTGLDTEAELQRRFFAPLSMTHTALSWRAHFEDNLGIGYSRGGERLGHDRRSAARAAGSMDTSIRDFATWMTRYIEGAWLSPAAQQDQIRAQTPIRSKHQFPTLIEDQDPSLADIKLAAGIGMTVFNGPQGRGFFKGGHDDHTDNQLICLVDQKRCLLLMMNSAKGDLIFPELTALYLGETGLPWRWAYNVPSD